LWPLANPLSRCDFTKAHTFSPASDTENEENTDDDVRVVIPLPVKNKNEARHRMHTSHMTNMDIPRKMRHMVSPLTTSNHTSSSSVVAPSPMGENHSSKKRHVVSLQTTSNYASSSSAIAPTLKSKKKNSLEAIMPDRVSMHPTISCSVCNDM
jgi:hypothetical protein